MMDDGMDAIVILIVRKDLVPYPYRPFENSAYSPGDFFSKKLQREKLHITSFSLQDSKLIDAFILN
jgi:hypothetical protein